jgi:hypothetical protein
MDDVTLEKVALLNRLERRNYYNSHRKDFLNWKDFCEQLKTTQD